MKTSFDSLRSEITPDHIYVGRRNFVKAGALAVSVSATSRACRRLNSPSRTVVNTATITLATSSVPASSGFRVDEESTSLEDITHYNNFYEFSTITTDAVADAAAESRLRN